MVMLLVMTAIACIIVLGVFIFMTERMAALQHTRIALHNALLREHRHYHKCRGGLGVSDSGGISHFTPGEGEDYDAARS